MGTKNFSNANDLITFSRASGGTALRKIAYGSELVTNGTFDTDISGWTTQAGGSTFTVSSGQLTISRSAVDPGYVYQTISTTAGNVYYVTFGVIDNGPIDLRVGTSPAGLQIASSGVKSSAGTYTLAFVATGASTYISLVNTSYSTDATVDNISVKEVLFDQGDLTLFNHPADIPRIEYDADGNVLGLLVEESRTNLVLNSGDLSGFGGVRSSLTSDQAASPTGNVDATAFIEDLTASNTHIGNLLVANPAAAGTYTFSVYAKQNGRQYFYVHLNVDPASTNLIYGVVFDLDAGTVANSGSQGVTTSTDHSIQDVGNGWYRCSVTLGNPSGLRLDARIALQDSSTFVVGGAGYNGDGVSGVYVYGAQVEAGAFPTSYIPTDGATATRSADVASIPVADFGYNQSGGSVLLEFSLPDSWVGSGFPSVIMLYEDGLNRFGLTTASNSDDFRFNGLDANVSQFDLAKTTNSTGESQKHIFAFESNSFVYVADSDTPSVDSSGTFPSISEIVIGGSGPTSGFINGHIKSIRYYPRRLTNAQLQELTT